MADILIKGALIGTQDAERRVYPDGAIAITGNRIVAVGPTAEVMKTHSAAKVIDAAGKIVMPGLICTHTHMPSVVGHNMPVDYSKFRSFMDLLTKWWWPDIEEANHSRQYLLVFPMGCWENAQNRHNHRCDMVEAPASWTAAWMCLQTQC